MNTSKNHFPTILISVAVLTAVLTVSFAVLHRFVPQAWIFSVAISFGTTCYHFAMRLIVGALVPPLKGTASWFRPRKWEAPLYRTLGVKDWKKHLPTYNPRQFSLQDNTWEQIIRNTCQAEVVHEVIILCSFLPLLTVPYFGAFWVFMITSLGAGLFDLLFVIAQRYNRPRLERIAKTSQKHKEDKL